MWIPDSAGNAKAGRAPVEAGALVGAPANYKGLRNADQRGRGKGEGQGRTGAAEYEVAGALACVTGTRAWRLRIGESHARTPHDAAAREAHQTLAPTRKRHSRMFRSRDQYAEEPYHREVNP